MSKSRCPGQDRRNWTPEDICYRPCPRCGTEIEFWKDEATRVCPGCEAEVENPNLNLACAQWCEMAAVCLGGDPRATSPARAGGPPPDQTAPICDCILTEMKAVFGEDRAPIDQAARVLARAEQILAGEGGDALVVKAAAILSGMSIQQAEALLQKLGIQARSIEQVSRILHSLHSEGDLDTPEFRIVRDAARLVHLPARYLDRDREALKKLIEGHFNTVRGRELARKELLD